MKICANPKCGKEFDAGRYPSGALNNRKTCSEACSRARNSNEGMDESERRRRSESAIKRWASAEARVKLSVISRGNWADPATRERMISGSKRSRSRPEYKVLMSSLMSESWKNQSPGRMAALAKMRRTKRTKKARAAQAAENRRRWSNPEFKERVSASLRAAYENPALRKVLSDLTKDRWRDPDFRERMCAILGVAQATPQARANHSVAIRKRLNDDPAEWDRLLNIALPKAWARCAQIHADPALHAEIMERILTKRAKTNASKKHRQAHVITAAEIADATMAIILDATGKRIAA